MLLWGVYYGLSMAYIGIWDMGYGWFVILSAGYIWSFVWFGVDIVFRPGEIVEDLVIRLQSDVI